VAAKRRRKSKRNWLARTPVQFVAGVILLWLGVVIVRNGNTGLGVVLLALGVGLAAVSVPKLIARRRTRRRGHSRALRDRRLPTKRANGHADEDDDHSYWLDVKGPQAAAEQCARRQSMACIDGTP
jgi:hypothetical protein